MRSFADNFSKIPSDFREDLLTRLSALLKKGMSVQLVSIPGMGSSIIARAITQAPQVKEKYLDKNVMVYLMDADELLERSPISLSRLFLSTIKPNTTITDDMILVQNEIEENISETCESGNLIIIFDHFNKLNQPELTPFFSNIGRLYRVYGPNLQFVFITSKPLETSEDLKNFEQFSRIVKQNIIAVDFMNEKDSLWFIGEVSKNLQLKLATKQMNKIFTGTGGFPRLMKRFVEAIHHNESLDQLFENPINSVSLKSYLNELASDRYLFDKIPILQKYLELKKMESAEDIVGEFIFSIRLTRLEEKLLKLFINSKNKIIKREDGIDLLWGDGAIDVSDHAYDQIILRLRRKLEKAKPSGEIETVRGRGHILKF